MCAHVCTAELKRDEFPAVLYVSEPKEQKGEGKISVLLSIQYFEKGFFTLFKWPIR